MVKNIIYLDIDKLYSLSSQIFEGVTEYILNETHIEAEQTEEQKGPVGSGRILGDILKHNFKQSEMKFLSDYSYTLLEKKLIEENLVLNLNDSLNKDDFNSLLNVKSFMKVKGKAVFNDISSIKNTLDNFNAIGKALTHVTNFAEISKAKTEIESSNKSIKDRNERSKIKTKLSTVADINALAKKSGLVYDQKYLDDLSYLLSFGFHDQLEIQIAIENKLISANLKRDCMREENNLVIRKYSRKTEVDFILFGIITQFQNNDITDVENKEESDNHESIKAALMSLVAQLTKVESTFTGRLTNEIIIDPIALYTEL